MGLEISDGVGVVIGKFLDFIDAPLGKVDVSCITDMHIAVRNAEDFLCEIQLALIGSADNQNHVVSSLKQCVYSHGAEFPNGQRVAGNIAIHAIQGFIAPAQSKAIPNQSAK